MKNTYLVGLVAATALFTLPALAADSAKEKPAAAAKPSLAPSYSSDATVIKVNDEKITYEQVNEVWSSLFKGTDAPEFSSFDEKVRQNVLRGMVSEKLIYEQAQKAGYDKNEEVQQRIEELAKQVVMQSFMEDKAEKLVSEKDLKALYAKKAAEAKGKKEIKARHILVAKEEEAKEIAAKLKKGESFEKLAKEESSDKGSGAQGGDLGWFGKERMVPEFADAAFKLKKGEISDPVKSAFGWHVIKVEDSRPVKFASYEEMKDGLKAEVSNKKVTNYIENLLKKADIAYYAPDGKEKPFERLIAPASGKDAGNQ